MNQTNLSHAQQTVTFIGGGNMGGSLLSGLLNQSYPASRLRLLEPNEQVRERYSALGVQCSDQAADVCPGADAIVVAVKPQIMPMVLARTAPALGAGQLLISVAAGVTVDAMQQQTRLDDHAARPVVRAMPNTPALIGAGITGLFASPQVTHDQRQLTQTILDAVGDTVWIEDEGLMDAVTAVSGSGPAYFFLLVEALSAAGESQGLPARIAAKLALQTGLGAMRMATQTATDPAELRQRVTSPGGTTAAALAVLEEHNLRRIMAQAVAAATQRGRELAAQAVTGNA